MKNLRIFEKSTILFDLNNETFEEYVLQGQY